MYILKEKQIGGAIYLYWVPNGNVTMIFIVALQVTEENGAYVPYLYWSQAPLVNVSDFFKGALVNSSYVANPSNKGTSFSIGTIQTSTSLGDFGGGIPLEPLIEYALDVGETVPDWVLSLVIPVFSIDIVPFTSNSQFFIAEITIATYSNNAYYICYEETSIPYNIEGYNYYIPMYYFYINYTS